MDALLSSLLENPESIGFPILFVGLLVWVMKQNNEREDRYLNTIDELTGSSFLAVASCDSDFWAY
jgi:hypothetical protein